MRKDELVFIGMIANTQPTSHKNSAIAQAKKTEVMVLYINTHWHILSSSYITCLYITAIIISCILPLLLCMNIFIEI